MIGWKILQDGEYRIELPRLSAQEEEVILKIEDLFREHASRRQVGNREEGEKAVRMLLAKYSQDEGIYLESKQMDYLVKAALLHIYGYAFLDGLLEDDEIEEISISGIGKPAYVYLRKKGWQRVNAAFVDEKALMDVINRMAKDIGRRITLQHPRLDAVLPDGSRLHASLPPISNGELTIRKFREKPFSPKELADGGLISTDALAFLSLLFQSDSSVVVAGNTASGKTTTLNSLFSFIPLNERVVITEETPEINIPHRHQVRLVANLDMGISLKDLVYDSLRMRPDRMIVGEVRNREETEALFDVLLGGQARGSYATFHAQSVAEAIRRWKLFGIDEINMRSVDAVVVQRRMLIYNPAKRKNDEIRRVVEISTISDSGDAVDIYHYDAAADCLKGGAEPLEKLGGKLGLSMKEMKEELGKRKNIISSAKGDFRDFFSVVQREFYGLEDEID